MSRVDSRHWTISTGCHFQNGHHNIAKIQLCTISSQFDMWVDNDVPNWFSTLNTFYRSQFQFGTSLSTHISNFDHIGQCWIFVVLWWPFWKWRPVEIVQCRDSILDIIIYPHIKLWWYRSMLIPEIEQFLLVAIFKMATTIPQKFNIVRYDQNLIYK
jgi:hypothetical protein